MSSRYGWPAFTLYLLLPMARTPTPSEELSYSQFLTAVQTGRVADVTVDDQAITGHLKDGERFRTFVPFNDTSYLALLQSHNVQIIVEPKPKSTLGPSLLLFLGRILFVSFFVLNGIGHITGRKMLTGYAHSLGVPAAGFLVPVAGILVLTGSVSIGLGLWPDLGAVLLVIFLVPVTLWVHPFWKMEGQQRQSQALNFWRNVSLMGVAIMIFSLSLLGPLPSAFPWALVPSSEVALLRRIGAIEEQRHRSAYAMLHSLCNAPRDCGTRHRCRREERTSSAAFSDRSLRL